MCCGRCGSTECGRCCRCPGAALGHSAGCQSAGSSELRDVLPGLRENGRRVRRAVGASEKEARAALLTQTSVIGLRAQGIEVEDAPQIKPRPKLLGRTIAAVVSGYVLSPPLKLRAKSVSKYRNALESFGELRTLVPDYLFSVASGLAFFLRSRGGFTFDSGR
jgi:hypothetical protein